MMSAHEALRLDGVSKTFPLPLRLRDILGRKETKHRVARALEKISFAVPRGESVALLGPNGAGKTTLLKIITTLLVPDAGRVRVLGHEAGGDDEKIKAAVGFVASQERGFYTRLTGRQNLEFFAALDGLSANTVKRRLDELFRFFGVGYEDRRFDLYSAGMKQKFCLMRGLLRDPEILLLDEPTKSLDHTSATALRSLLKDKLLRQNKTILFTTHHIEEAAELANRFIILKEGRIHLEGTLEELRRKIKNPAASLGEILTS